jgi:hypothetical protein
MSVQDKNYEMKYLKYKQKYAELKEMEAGAGFSIFNRTPSSKILNLSAATNLFSSSPEQLVVANRKKYQDSKLKLNSLSRDLEDAKLKEKFASKEYAKDKTAVNLTKLNNAENARKQAQTAITSAERNIEFAKSEYKKSKEVFRKLKLDNAEKAVTEAQNKLVNAQSDLNKVKQEEQDRITRKVNKNSPSSSRSSSPIKLLKDGSPDDDDNE